MVDAHLKGPNVVFNNVPLVVEDLKIKEVKFQLLKTLLGVTCAHPELHHFGSFLRFTFQELYSDVRFVHGVGNVVDVSSYALKLRVDDQASEFEIEMFLL